METFFFHQHNKQNIRKNQMVRLNVTFAILFCNCSTWWFQFLQTWHIVDLRLLHQQEGRPIEMIDWSVQFSMTAWERKLFSEARWKFARLEIIYQNGRQCGTEFTAGGVKYAAGINIIRNDSIKF